MIEEGKTKNVTRGTPDSNYQKFFASNFSSNVNYRNVFCEVDKCKRPRLKKIGSSHELVRSAKTGTKKSLEYFLHRATRNAQRAKPSACPTPQKRCIREPFNWSEQLPY